MIRSPQNYREENLAYRDGKLAGEPVFEKPRSKKLTLEKRKNLRLHAEQILEVQRDKKQYHWTQKQEHDYAIWMLEVLDELDRVEKNLDRSRRLRDLENA